MDQGYQSTMKSTTQNFFGRNRPRLNSGAILIYVLWILAVITALAFQLSSNSRAATLSQSAFANQLKGQMQLESAIQFAAFKIIANQWQDEAFELELNDQIVSIRIFNEAGFVPIYSMSNKTLVNIFDSIGLEQSARGRLEKAVSNNDSPVRFNSFNELRQFDGFSDEVIQRLIPLVSVYNEESANPRYSPVEVLQQFHRVDQFRVSKLNDVTDEDEKLLLRRQIVETLIAQGLESSQDLSAIYRAHIVFDAAFYRVFLKYNRQKKKYIVLLIARSGIDADEQKLSRVN